MIEAPYIVETDGATAAVVHLSMPRTDLPKVVPGAIAELLKEIAAQGLAPQGPMFMHHLTMSADTFDVEVGFPIARAISPTGRVKPGALPAVKVARTIYQGPYEGLFGAWDAFGKRLEREGLLDRARFKRADTLWESYLVGPGSTNDASQWRTELNLPLRPARQQIQGMEQS